MKVKTILILLLLVGVLGGFIIAPAILQSAPSQGQMPKNNIIDYQLNPMLVQYGITLLTFEYNSGCANYTEQKNFLEFMVTDYKEILYTDPTDIYNIYLSEIVNETITSSELTILGSFGNTTLTNPTENETFSKLCEFMATPPIECVTKLQ